MKKRDIAVIVACCIAVLGVLVWLRVSGVVTQQEVTSEVTSEDTSSEEEEEAEATAEPQGSTVFQLTTGKYYRLGDQLCELAAYVDKKGNIKTSKGKKIGKVKKNTASITFKDLYYLKKMTLTWDIDMGGYEYPEIEEDVEATATVDAEATATPASAVEEYVVPNMQLQTGDWVFDGYRYLYYDEEAGRIYNVSEWIEERDGQAYWVMYDGHENDLEATSSMPESADEEWVFGMSDYFDMFAKKEDGEYYYYQEFYSSDG